MINLKSTITLLGTLLLIASSSAGAKQQVWPVQGKIEWIEKNEAILGIRHDGIPGYAEDPGSLDVIVSVGDYLIAEIGRPFEAELYLVDDVPHMRTIWPKVEETEYRMGNINDELRENTLARGDDVFRKEGEYLPNFAFYDQHAKLVSMEDLKGKVTVLNFIFTRCKMANMCPAATMRMSQLQRRLISDGVMDGVRLVSITLDPDYDTPGVFFEYAKARGIDSDSFLFLGGSKDAVEDMKKQIGVIAIPSENAIIAHSMATVLIDTQGKIVFRVPGTRWFVKDFYRRVLDLLPEEEE